MAETADEFEMPIGHFKSPILLESVAVLSLREDRSALTKFDATNLAAARARIY